MKQTLAVTIACIAALTFAVAALDEEVNPEPSCRPGSESCAAEEDTVLLQKQAEKVDGTMGSDDTEVVAFSEADIQRHIQALEENGTAISQDVANYLETIERAATNYAPYLSKLNDHIRDQAQNLKKVLCCSRKAMSFGADAGGSSPIPVGTMAVAFGTGPTIATGWYQDSGGDCIMKEGKFWQMSVGFSAGTSAPVPSPKVGVSAGFLGRYPKDGGWAISVSGAGSIFGISASVGKILGCRGGCRSFGVPDKVAGFNSDVLKAFAEAAKGADPDFSKPVGGVTGLSFSPAAIATVVGGSGSMMKSYSAPIPGTEKTWRMNRGRTCKNIKKDAILGLAVPGYNKVKRHINGAASTAGQVSNGGYR